MFKITKTFKACENGIDIVTYTEGDLHKELPKIALAHGETIAAIEKLKGKALTAALAEQADQELAEQLNTDDNAE